MSGTFDPTRPYGRLTVAGEPVRTPLVGRGRPPWMVPCRCSCGAELMVSRADLAKRRVRTCGTCDEPAKGYRVHGHAGRRPSATYRIWHGMIQRCEAPNASGFDAYGAKGVRVCDRWRNDFAAFLADMGERPVGKSIDRYPNGAGDYEPGNCRWATPKEQSRNTKSNRLVTFRGETHPLIVWAERIGAGPMTITSRLNRGWPIERALTEPVGKYSRAA